MLGMVFAFAAAGLQAQVYEMHYQGFESGEAVTYQVTSSSFQYDSSLVKSGSRSLRLVQSATEDIELVTDVMDFSQIAGLRYVALEFDHICNVNTNIGANAAKIGELYVKRASQSDAEYVQLTGSEHYNKDGDSYSSAFSMLSAYNRNSYDVWRETTMSNSYWKHERFDVNSILSGAADVADRKLVFKFVLRRCTRPAGVSAEEGWWIDNLRVRASQAQMVTPKLDMVLYPDGGQHPSSRGARIELDAYTTLPQGIDQDSVYVVYQVGSDGTRHRVAMTSLGAAPRHDGVSATRFACRIPFYGYDTVMHFYCVVKDATTNGNEVTFPLSANSWVDYWCVRGVEQANASIPQVLAGTSTRNTLPFPAYADNRSEWVYDSALMSMAGYGPGAITALRFVLGGATQAQQRENLQIRMKNVETGYTVSEDMDNQEFTSGYMHVVWDSTLNIVQSDAGAEVLIRLQDTFFYAGKDLVMQVIYDGTGSANPAAATVQTIGASTGKKSKVYAGADYSYGYNPYVADEFKLSSRLEGVRPVVVMTENANLPLVYDMGVAAIAFPNETSPVMSQPARVEVALQNYGTQPVSAIRISYSIDNGAATGHYDWSGSLGSSATTNVTVATGITLTPGYHTLRAWVEDTLTSNGRRYRDHEPFNDTAFAEFIVCAAPLSGVKTVGGAGADYASLREFLFNAASCGVSDSVVVRLAPGYYEPFTMPAIAGVSAQHYVVFEPASGSVTFYADAATGSTAIADLSGASNVRFRNIGFVRRSGALRYIASLGAASDNCQFYNCTFTDSLANQSSALRIDAMVYSAGGDNLQASRCTFTGGGIGIDVQGVSAADRASGIRIDHCLFSGQYNNAVSVRNATGAVVDHNEMYDVASNTSYVLLAYECNGATAIRANKIYTTHGAGGMAISDVVGTSAGHVEIANNMIVCEDDGSANIQTTPFNILQGEWIDVVYNAVKLKAPTRSNTAAVTFGGSQVSNSRLLNNIIACYDASSYALSYLPSTADNNRVGYNVYYTEGSTLNRYGTTPYATLDAWKAVVVYDSTSMAIDPVFLNTERVDLRTYNRFIKGKGTPISTVGVDMFDSVRHASHPCPGAFEYAALHYDFEVEALVNPPADTCKMPASVNLAVRLRNDGLNSYSYGAGDTLFLSCQMNGGTVQKVAVSQAVPAEGATTVTTGMTYQLPSNGLFDSVYDFKLWVSYAGDPNQTNDTSRFSVVSRYHQPAADNLTMTIPYASQATVAPTAGVGEWAVYGSASAPKKRSQIYWYYDTTDVAPFYHGDTLVTSILRQDTHFYFKQRRQVPMVRLTQVQIKGTSSVGLTTPTPSWMSSSTKLAVQLTNIGDDTAYLYGDTLKVLFSQATNNQTMRFGDVRLAPGKSVVVQFAAGTASSSKTVYSGVNMSVAVSASQALGFVYKHEGVVEDALPMNSIMTVSTWTDQAVPAYVWSGSSISGLSSTVGGVVRTAFNGVAADWRTATQAAPMFLDTMDLAWLKYVDNGCPTDFAKAMVNMATHPAVDISLQAVPLATGCGLGNEQVSVVVHNYGRQAATGVQLHYSAMGGSTVTETLPGSVASEADVAYTFNQRLNMTVSRDSLFRVVIWATKLASDSEQSNDTTLVEATSLYTPSAPVVASTMTVNYGASITIPNTAPAGMTMIWYDSMQRPIDTTLTFVSEPLYEQTRIGVGYVVADSNSGQIGLGTARTSSTAYPSPYQPSNMVAKQQFIYSASELRVLGIRPGDISSVAFQLNSILGGVSSLTFNRYYISMGLTADTVFSANTAWKETQMVYSRTPFIINQSDAGQWVNHKLDTPFVWDGVSSLVVQVVHENSSAVTSGVEVLYTSKENTCLYYSANSPLSPSALEYAEPGRLSANRPNIRVEQVLYGCKSPISPITIAMIGRPALDARISWPGGYDTITYTSCGNVALQVNLQNLGTQQFNSLKLHYTIDGRIVDSTMVSTTVRSGSSVQTQLFSRQLAPGRHHVQAIATLLGDEVSDNDTITLDIVVRFCGGNYTIATAQGSDFHSFNEAVDTMMQVGIVGAVVFQVAAGTYEEQVSIGAVPGASSINTITFQGAYREGVVLKAATTSGANYVLRLDGASYISIDSLSILSSPMTGNYANVVVLQNTHDISLLSNIIRVDGAVDNDNASCVVLQGNVSNLALMDNVLDSGFYSLRIAGTTYNYSNFNIQGNSLTNFRNSGIDLQDVAGLNISMNKIRSAQSVINRSLSGVSLSQVNGNFTFSKNQIYLVDDMNGGKRGLSLNKVKCGASAYGNIVNNMISACGTGVASVSSPGGIICMDCEYLNFFYNSVQVRSGNSSLSRGMLLSQTASDTSHHVLVMNNIIANRSSYSYYVTHPSIVSSSDYNNYVAPTGSPLAYWGADQSNLASLQVANGRDGSSMAEEAYFVSDSNLHLVMTNLSGKAQYNPDVPDDIDGTMRPQLPPPTIGAHQMSLTAHNMTLVRVLSPVMPASIARPINVEGDSILVKAVFYNNGSSTENNIRWYAYLEGYESQTRADRQLGTFLPTQTIIDSVWLYAPYGVIDTQSVRVVLVAPNDSDSDTADNVIMAPVYLASAFNLSTISIETSKMGCDMQQTDVMLTVTNVGAKDIPAGFTAEIGYTAQAYFPTYDPANPSAYRQAVSTMPGTVRETATFTSPLQRGQSRTLTFSSPANFFPSDTAINLQILLHGWSSLTYDITNANDSVWSDVINSYYSPRPAVGHDTTFAYGTWGELTATQPDYRAIKWYRDTTGEPFYDVSNYFNSCRWSNTPAYFHDSTYYLRSVSDIGCLSPFSEIHVHVAPQQANDVALAAVLAPVARRVYMENDTVRVRIANYGTQTQRSIPITYEVRNGNNTAPFQTVTQVCTASIGPNQTYDFQFDSLIRFTDPTAGSTYYLRVWTDLATDAVRRNDTVRWNDRLRPVSPNNTLLDYPFVSLPESTYGIRQNTPTSSTVDVVRVSFNEIDMELPPLGRSFTNLANFSSPEYPVLHLTRGTQDTLTLAIADPAHPEAAPSGNVAVYIDFNRSGTFYDAGENVLSSTSVSNRAPVKTLVTIPQSSATGYMRMRVVAANDGVSPDPLVSSEQGHIVDFLLFIDAEPPISDLALTQIASPHDGLLRTDSTLAVSLRMSNKGSSTVSRATLYYSFYFHALDSLYTDSLQWTGSLASGRSTLVSLPGLVVPYGTMDFKVWHSLSSDVNRTNDTLVYEYHRSYVTTLVYADNFDRLDRWYAPKGYNDYTQNQWQRGIPVKNSISGAHSFPYAWATNLRTDVSVGTRGSISYLYSPIINIAQIRSDSIVFYLRRNFENNSSLRLEYYDYTGVWKNVQNDSVDAWYTNDSRTAFTGIDDGDYERFAFSTIATGLSDDFHEFLQFRFVYTAPQGAADNTAFGEGCAIDDIAFSRARRRIDVGVVGVTHPTTPRFGETIYPEVAVRNYGLDTARSFQIGYTTYGNYIARITNIRCNIPPDSTEVFAFSDPLEITSDFPDTFSITAFTILTEDIYFENDTATTGFRLAPLGHDICAVELVAPRATVIGGDSLEVTLRIRNYGSDSLSRATLSYIFNSTTRFDEEVDFVQLIGRPLASFEYFNYTFHDKVRAPMGMMNFIGIAKSDSNFYLRNDTVSKRVVGISSVSDVAAASVIIDSSNFNTMKVQLVIENRGARGVNDFEVGFWYDNDPANIHRETFHRDVPLPALTSITHSFDIELPARQIPYTQVVGFVHMEGDHDSDNDTTTTLSTQFVDLEVIDVLVEENANPDCRVFIRLRNEGNLAVVNRTLPLRAVVNGTELSINVMRNFEPGILATVEFPVTVPKSDLRRYAGSGWLQNFPMDINPSNNQTSVVRVVNYVEGVPMVDAGQLVLGQNYPNPFSYRTVVPFSLPSDAVVHFFVMDAMGKLVADKEVFGLAGSNTLELDMSAFSAGVYYYGIEVAGERRMHKLILR